MNLLDRDFVEYRPPPKDLTPTRILILRGVMIGRQPTPAGSILSVERWLADELVATGKARMK